MSEQEEEPTAKTEAEEAEIVTGLLPFNVGGREIVVPELKWRDKRAWEAAYYDTNIRLAGAVPLLTPEGQQGVEDAERELVLAYDRTHVLGDLEDMTVRQIHAIFERLLDVSFPLASSQMTMMLAIIQAAIENAEKSQAASSMSGPSPTGTTAAPTILKGHLRTARSSSSTRKRRSA
jgi:hypothetical protein